jgi:hypothetical protein
MPDAGGESQNIGSEGNDILLDDPSNEMQHNSPVNCLLH